MVGCCGACPEKGRITNDREMFFVLAWLIWKCRNDTWLNQPHLEAFLVGTKVVAYAEEFFEANQCMESARPISKNKWLPPPSSHVKLNIAWKCFPIRNSFGIGPVLRDHIGVLIASHCEVIHKDGDGLHMAATAVIKVLTIYNKAGFQNILVEFSHPHLKALIMAKEKCLTELVDSIHCIRHFFSVFHSLGFHVVPRSCNKVAILLASYAKEFTEPSIWLEEGQRFSFQLLLLNYLNL